MSAAKFTGKKDRNPGPQPPSNLNTSPGSSTADLQVLAPGMKPNPYSTCEWVDEAYSKRLWGRLVRRAMSVPSGARRSLLTVRKHAYEVVKVGGQERGWMAILFVPGPEGALELLAAAFDRNGRFLRDRRLLRISQHAGQRLFERLRTNSDEDLLDTLRAALVALMDSGALEVEEHKVKAATVNLPWGKLHLATDLGEKMWTAKTFIPEKLT
jgi:hypothetical protein